MTKAITATRPRKQGDVPYGKFAVDVMDDLYAAAAFVRISSGALRSQDDFEEQQHLIDACKVLATAISQIEAAILKLDYSSIIYKMPQELKPIIGGAA